MRIYELNPVVNEDSELSNVVTARSLVTKALNNPVVRQEYFDYITHLRTKHGKEYSTRIHQKATELAKSVDETIRKVGSQYELVSKSGKNLGKYPTRAGAEKREQQVNYFKHVKEYAWTGDNPAWHNSNDQWNDGTDQWYSTAGTTGSVSAMAMAEDINPMDVIKVDVPLMIRLLEYAREDANTDMDLHNITERLIALSQQGTTLTMQDYDTISSTKETDQ